MTWPFCWRSAERAERAVGAWDGRGAAAAATARPGADSPSTPSGFYYLQTQRLLPWNAIYYMEDGCCTPPCRKARAYAVAWHPGSRHCAGGACKENCRTAYTRTHCPRAGALLHCYLHHTATSACNAASPACL